ncbi:MAG: radical SAM protein [Candidatus Nealsonbacteria bacterium]|nr:MAG: radical SAM protein [Candidatus Nealsonbacteria bacterium]
MKVREIQCKSAIGKCGFPGGGLAINPYVGCGHSCVYCYARFIKRFTGHTEEWGTFVDARINIADVLKKQLKSPKYKGERIFIGTVTDPYQPIEKEYKLTRGILQVLIDYKNPVSILTKSDLVLRDIALLKKMKDVDVNFTVTTLDEKWKKLIEPNSSTIRQRLKAVKKLTKEGITVLVMMGPYWPVFTNPEALFKEFKRVRVKYIFTESFNTVGGNWTGVEKVLKKNYPKLLSEIQETLFNKKKFYEFYNKAQGKIRQLSKEYKIPVTIYFGLGHAAKFK